MSRLPEYWAPDSAFGGKTDKYRFGCRTCDKAGKSGVLFRVTKPNGEEVFASPAVYDSADEAATGAKRHQVNIHGENRPWL